MKTDQVEGCTVLSGPHTGGQYGRKGYVKFPRTSPRHKENKTSRHAIALGEVQRFCCSQGFERSRPRRPTKHLCDPPVWPKQKLGVGVGDEDHRGPDEALIPAALVPGVVSFPCCLVCSCQPGFLFTSACWVQRSSFSRRPPGVRWPRGVSLLLSCSLQRPRPS